MQNSYFQMCCFFNVFDSQYTQNGHFGDICQQRCHKTIVFRSWACANDVSPSSVFGSWASRALGLLGPCVFYLSYKVVSYFRRFFPKQSLLFGVLA